MFPRGTNNRVSAQTNKELAEKMKHLKVLSSEMPAKAVCGEDHPGLGESVKGLIEAPLEVLRLHVDFLTNKGEQAE